MLSRLVIGGLILLAFAAGYFLGLPDSEEGDLLRQQLASAKQEGERLTERNADLEETLALVKRQVQTDRIAYDNLQQSVEASDRERAQLQERLESQRALLDRLKKKLDDS